MIVKTNHHPKCLVSTLTSHEGRKIETRMSKRPSAYHFDPINFQNPAFFYLDVVRIRATRHSKAEIVNFTKIKFLQTCRIFYTLRIFHQLGHVCQKYHIFKVNIGWKSQIWKIQTGMSLKLHSNTYKCCQTHFECFSKVSQRYKTISRRMSNFFEKNWKMYFFMHNSGQNCA